MLWVIVVIQQPGIFGILAFIKDAGVALNTNNKIVVQKESPDHQWFATIEYRDAGGMMFEAPLYRVKLKPVQSIMPFSREESIFEIQAYEDIPPEISWQDKAMLMIKYYTLPEDILLQKKEYGGIHVIYSAQR